MITEAATFYDDGNVECETVSGNQSVANFPRLDRGHGLSNVLMDRDVSVIFCLPFFFSTLIIRYIR